MVRISTGSPEDYLVRPLVDQLNKILEILGVPITEISFPMASDEKQGLPTVTF
jgi:hypothetical protein